MLGVVALEPLLVGREAEEPVALGEPLERYVGMVRAVGPVRVLHEVVLGDEALAGAVPPFVVAHIEVAVDIGAADHLVHGRDMVGVGRAEEPVWSDPERVLGFLEEAHHLVDEVLRVPVELRRSLGDVD